MSEAPCEHCRRRGVACTETGCAAADPRQPYTPDACRPCWLRLRERLGRSAATPLPCRHLGGPTGETVSCPWCRGHVELKLLACAVYGKCTPTRRVPDVACCVGCPSYSQPESVTVNMGAGGMGDALLGLTAVGALKASRPSRHVTYAANPGALPFVALFGGGYDRLEAHTHDANGDLTAAPGVLQVNNGYNAEVATKAARPRWQRYLDNVGAAGPPVLPRLREPDRLRVLGRDFAGCVVLAPFSTWSNREYPLLSWLTLEGLLRRAGYRVVVVDGRPDRCGDFVSEKILGAPAERLAGLLLNCACLVGNDSGPAHLAGCLGVSAVVLCGQTTGKDVYGLYPSVRWLSGHLACSGCWWQRPYHGTRCDAVCACLASISPAEVLAEVDRAALPALAGHRAVLSHDKLAVLRDLVIQTAGLPGDIAELGVYRGGSARLIGHFAPGTTLHLYDTFAGQPADDQGGAHRAGDFANTSEAEVLAFLGSPYAVAHAGVFPAVAPADARYRFAHVDADTYKATRAALDYFLPRLTSGGVVLFDDYGWFKCPGVARAVHEALGEKAPLGRPTLHQAVWRKP